MPIDKRDLLTALGSLSDDELAGAGLRRAKTETHPFRPKDSEPDRVKRVDGDNRWYQLQVGDTVAELHISETGCVIHRYVRKYTPAAPLYLLDGYEGVETLDASDLATADDPSIWSVLAQAAPRNPGRKVRQRYGQLER